MISPKSCRQLWQKNIRMPIGSGRLSSEIEGLLSAHAPSMNFSENRFPVFGIMP